MERCNGLGSEWETVACRAGLICEDGACQERICVEGEEGCFDEDTRGVCNADGLAFIEGEDCPASHRCERGFCIDPCEAARSATSYDGCRFFAVDLPQIGEANRRQDTHPFAVVLANATEVEGTITVSTRGEAVVEMVASQEVVFTSQLGQQLRETVFSYVSDANGRRRNISGRAESIVLPPGGMATIILPNASAGTVSPVVQTTEAQFRSELTSIAYRVDTTVPVTAYQFQPLCCSHSYTADASILIPAGSLGREYYAVASPHFLHTWPNPLGQPVRESLPGFVSIVASDQEARVAIEIGDKRVALPQGMTLDNNGVLHAQLRPYDVLTLISAEGGTITQGDLTGLHITATEEIAVFGGHTCAYLPFRVMACDHMESLNMPVETWRAEYVAAHTVWRGTQRTEVNYYRVQAKEANTALNFDPPLSQIATTGTIESGLPDCRHMGQVPTLDAGEWCEFGTRSDFHLRGSEPIALTQFITSALTAGSSGFGLPLANSADPAMSAVPPVAQFRTSYNFLMADTYELSYAVLIHGIDSILQIDGVGVNRGEMGDPGRNLYLLEGPDQIGESAWHRTVVRVPAGAHQARDMTRNAFGLMVHAYDDNVSYAYPGGMNMTKAQ
jgi:hypothetical protein